MSKEVAVINEDTIKAISNLVKYDLVDDVYTVELDELANVLGVYTHCGRLTLTDPNEYEEEYSGDHYEENESDDGYQELRGE